MNNILTYMNNVCCKSLFTYTVFIKLEHVTPFLLCVGINWSSNQGKYLVFLIHNNKTAHQEFVQYKSIMTMINNQRAGNNPHDLAQKLKFKNKKV